MFQRKIRIHNIEFYITDVTDKLCSLCEMIYFNYQFCWRIFRCAKGKNNRLTVRKEVIAAVL